MFSNIISIIQKQAEEFGNAIAEHLPRILTAIIVLIIFLVVAKILRLVVRRVLAKTPLDPAISGMRIGQLLESMSPGMKMSDFFAQVVYILALLLAWTSVAEVLQLESLKSALSSAIAYTPKVIAAMIILFAGAALASFVRKGLHAMLSDVRNPGVRMLESVAEFAIYFIVLLIALESLGVDTSIVKSNMAIIMGALVIILSFLFCFAMRVPAQEIIANYYLRLKIHAGDEVELNGVSGKVHTFTPLGVMIDDGSGTLHFVPAAESLSGLKKQIK